MDSLSQTLSLTQTLSLSRSLALALTLKHIEAKTKMMGVIQRAHGVQVDTLAALATPHIGAPATRHIGALATRHTMSNTNTIPAPKTKLHT